MIYKHIYLLIFTFVGLIHASLSLDLIIFSFDRPMQLYALLESIQTRWTGISHATVLYRASNADFEKAYQTTLQDFSHVTFQRHFGKHDFQNITTDIIRKSQSTHLFFGVDDIIVTDECDLEECLHTLETTNAYCFALRLGKNTTECYTCNLITPNPTFNALDNSILSFQFGESKGDWDYPNSLDMTIYRRNTVIDFINGNYEWAHPNFMEGQWACIAPKNVTGLCCMQSKIVNIPMNVVNVDWESRNMKNYSTHELVALFNDGYRIDINCVYKYLPRAPHEEINLTFTKK